MKGFFLFVLFFLHFISFAQEDDKLVKSTSLIVKKSKSPIATIDQYKIITIEKDSIVYDTSLTIHDEYRFNYLRKDIFGLMPFPNEGQPFNTLDFGLNKYKSLPNIGFSAKHFNLIL